MGLAIARNKLPKDTVAGFLFILPFLSGFILFRLLPLIYGFILSVMDYNSLSKFGRAGFVGFANYLSAVSQPIVRTSFLRSFQFTLVYTAGILSLSLFTAVLLNQRFFARPLSRTLIYLPYVSNIIAVGIIWSIVLNPGSGPVNLVLQTLGLPQRYLPRWLLGLDTALPTVAMINVWLNLAFQTIVFLAALQDVPQELYECSSIDGITRLGKFVYITMPLVSPTTFYLLVVTIIGSFQNYALVRSLTNGGPGTATRVISLNMYEDAFMYTRFSYASAQAILLFLIILFVTILQWKGQKKWVHY